MSKYVDWSALGKVLGIGLGVGAGVVIVFFGRHRRHRAIRPGPRRAPVPGQQPGARGGVFRGLSGRHRLGIVLMTDK
jgi:hypothetical protein